MRIKRWSLPILFALCVLAIPVAAQSESPVYLTVSGELMRYTPGAGALEPVTACALPGEAYYEAPVISPDGTLLALRLKPKFLLETLERVGGLAGGEYPSDIVVCDPARGIVARVYQPEGAALADPNAPDLFLMRSAPAWSGDGSALTWTEGLSDTEPMTLQVLTLADATVQTIAQLPPQYGVPTSLPVAWSDGPLIAVISYGWDEIALESATSVLGYDPATGLLAFEAPITMSDFSFPYAHFWLDVAGAPQVAVLMSSGAWLTFDPATGAQSLLEGAPELVSAAAPEGVTVVADATALQVANLRWLAREGETVTPLGEDVRGFVPPSVAPDGSAVLFYDNLMPAIWHGGALEYLPLPPLSPNDPAYGVWGYGHWQAFMGEYAPADGGFVCFGAPSLRLTVGGRARVSEEFGNNNLRAEPDPSAELLGVISAGDEVDVIGGPVCVSGYAWWQIDYDGDTGWTAEGEGLDYWLEPVN